jgi:hypothetical protein
MKMECEATTSDVIKFIDNRILLDINKVYEYIGPDYEKSGIKKGDLLQLIEMPETSTGYPQFEFREEDKYIRIEPVVELLKITDLEKITKEEKHEILRERRYSELIEEFNELSTKFYELSDQLKIANKRIANQELQYDDLIQGNSRILKMKNSEIKNMKSTINLVKNMSYFEFIKWKKINQ